MNAETLKVVDLLKAMDVVTEISESASMVLEKRRINASSSDWNLVRGKLLTATNLASLLRDENGKSMGFLSERELFLRKTNQIPRWSGNVATQWGVDHETEASKVYTAITGLQLVEEEIGLLVHDYENPQDAGRKRYGATPDFLTLNGILVEIKCPFRRKITHTIPAYYMPQVQLQLEITGLDMLHFVQYKPPTYHFNGEIDILPIERDPGWFERNVPIFDNFFDRVLTWYNERGLVMGERTHQPETPLLIKKETTCKKTGSYEFVTK